MRVSKNMSKITPYKIDMIYKLTIEWQSANQISKELWISITTVVRHRKKMNIDSHRNNKSR